MPPTRDHSVLEFPSAQPLLVDGRIDFNAAVEAVALARRLAESAWSIGSRIKVTGIQFAKYSVSLHLLERRSSEQQTLPEIESAEVAAKQILIKLMANRISELNDESRSAAGSAPASNCDLPGGKKASAEQVACLDRLLKKCARDSIFAAPEACGDKMPVTAAFPGRSRAAPLFQQHEIEGKQTGTLNSLPVVEGRYVLKVDATTTTPEGLLKWSGSAFATNVYLLQLTQCAQGEFDFRAGHTEALDE